MYTIYFPVRLCVFDALTIMSCWGRRGFVHLVQHCGFFRGGLSLKRERERHKESLCKGIFISVAILPLEASSSTFSHMTIIYFKLYGCTAREESHGCDPITAIKGDVFSEILVIYPDM